MGDSQEVIGTKLQNMRMMTAAMNAMLTNQAFDPLDPLSQQQAQQAFREVEAQAMRNLAQAAPNTPRQSQRPTAEMTASDYLARARGQ